MVGLRGRGALALVLLLVVSLSMIVPALSPASPRAPSGSFPVQASATVVTIRALYADSQYLEVNWTRTLDTCFRDYVFNFSANAAALTTVATITDANATDVQIIGLTAGTVYYYQIFDTDCGGQTAHTPIYVIEEPNPGLLSYTWVNDTSVRLHWVNNYSYGGSGHLAFLGYGVEYSGNHTILKVISDVTARNYTFNATSAGAVSLDVLTEDICDLCNPYNPPIFTSNVVTFTTTAPVTAVASVTPPTTEVGVGVSLGCTASSGVAPYTYAWAFGDGQTASGPNVTHTYASQGTKDATCTATDAHSGTAVSHVAVTVQPALSVTAASSAVSVAPGSAIVFNATVTGGTGGPYTITWNFGDGSSGTGAIATHTYTTAGTFIPTVTVTDSLGGTTTKQLPAITVSSGLGDLAVIGGIGAIVLVAVVAVAFLLMRKRKRGPANPPGATPPPSP